ncbi:MAG: hypothetical protein WBP61_06620 [Nocardioides sp.]
MDPSSQRHRHLRPWRWSAAPTSAARGTRLAAVGVALAMCIAFPACTSDPRATGDPEAQGATGRGAETQPVTVDVTPGKAFHLELPDGTTVDGPPGAVTAAGAIVVTPASFDVPATAPLSSAQVSGFELTYPGKLRRPLAVSFPAPELSPAATSGGTASPSADRTATKRQRGKQQWLPAAAHISDDGQWVYRDVVARGGRFEFATTEFSSWAPAWLDPMAWVRSMVETAGRVVTGTTEPPDCKEANLSWAQLLGNPLLTHECFKDNKDSEGESRAEVFLKSNRTSYLKVSRTGDGDYLWRSGADTLLGAALTGFIGADDPVMLAGGEQMSVGFRRPQLDSEQSLTAYVDTTTTLISFAQELISLVGVGGDDRGGFAALWAIQSCADKLPASLDDPAGWWDTVVCVFADALPQVADPAKATEAAYSLLELSPATYAKEGGARLVSTARAVQLLGKAVKVIGLVQVLRTAIRHVIDGADEAVNGRGSVTLRLEAGSESTARLLNSSVPAHSCVDETGGWDGPTGIQLREGQGEQVQPGGDHTSILESQVLGWADFDGDGQREVAMMLRCSGSPIASCCAGQSSLLWFINVFDVSNGSLQRTGDPLSGQFVGPGNQYGRASTAILEATLNGTAITTSEGVLYADSYTTRELGGLDPFVQITTTWTLGPDGTWSGDR